VLVWGGGIPYGTLLSTSIHFVVYSVCSVLKLEYKLDEMISNSHMVLLVGPEAERAMYILMVRTSVQEVVSNHNPG